MPAQNEEVTVKRLPGGPELQAIVKTLEGRRLELELRTAGTSALPMGALVEIASSARLYLGQIRGSHDELVVVGIEHAVDQGALAGIAKLWQKKS